MFDRIKMAFLIFLHPQSPAAIYKNPLSLPKNILARTLNVYLKLVNRLSPKENVTCNICGWHGRKFGYTAAISVDSFRSNEICLQCGSNHRTRTLIDILSQNVSFLNENVTVADVGASKATRRYFAKFPHVKYLSVDRFKNSDIVCDITNIKLPNDSVEIVLCCHTLEHVLDYKKGFSELYRILKPGGRGIIAVPQTESLKDSRQLKTETFYGYGHIWEFGNDFADKLKEVGFEVKTVYDSFDKNNALLEFIPYHIVNKPEMP